MSSAMRFVVADPMPGVRLIDMEPSAVKARCWLSRASQKSDFPEIGGVQIVGSIHIIAGLEYHRNRFMLLVRGLYLYYARSAEYSAELASAPISRQIKIPTASEAEASELDALDHEAIAYFNRLGQMFYFIRSTGHEAIITRISQLMSFRNKHAAHRSIDVPRSEDQMHLQNQAMAFGFYRMMQDNFPCYKIADEGVHKLFRMDTDHLSIMTEAIQVLQAIYPLPNDA
jgi:hypothetical protein